MSLKIDDNRINEIHAQFGNTTMCKAKMMGTLSMVMVAGAAIGLYFGAKQSPITMSKISILMPKVAIGAAVPLLCINGIEAYRLPKEAYYPKERLTKEEWEAYSTTKDPSRFKAVEKRNFIMKYKREVYSSLVEAVLCIGLSILMLKAKVTFSQFSWGIGASALLGPTGLFDLVGFKQEVCERRV